MYTVIGIIFGNWRAAWLIIFPNILQWSGNLIKIKNTLDIMGSILVCEELFFSSKY
jgi:hypothetical protein